jgi:DNA-binding CsgD family transcriptional regulator
MNKLINPTFNNFWLFLLSILAFSCHNTIQQDKKELINSERFFQKLPIENPDSTIQLIKDSISDENELQNLDKMLLKKLHFRWNPKTLPTYLSYLQPRLFKEGGDKQGFFEVIKGKYYYGTGRIDSGLILMKSGLELLKKGKDSLQICWGFIELGRFYVTQEYNLLGTETAIAGLKYTSSTDTSLVRIELRNILLSSYTKTGRYKEAKKLAFDILGELEKEKKGYDFSIYYGLLTRTFAALHQEDSAIWAAQKHAEMYQLYYSPKASYNVLNLGLVWKAANQLDKALFYLLKSKRRADSLGIKPVALITNVGLGNTYLAMNEFENAEKYYKELLADENFSKNARYFRNVSDSMVVLKLKKSKDYENLAYFYKARQLTDTLAARENNLVWSEMNIRYESSEKEKEILSLANEKNLYQLQGLIILLVLLIVLGITTWYFYQNRQKQQQLAKENALLEENQQLLAIKNELQEKEIRTNKEQLETFRENLSTKMQLVDEMEKQMSLLMENASCIANEEIVQSKEKLNEMKILTDKDWRTYLNYIEKVYPTLIQNIKQKYIDLTEGELRLFVLIYLGFSTAEISNILGISIASVHKNRHRLRRKLALTEEVSLEEFVKNSF